HRQKSTDQKTGSDPAPLGRVLLGDEHRRTQRIQRRTLSSSHHADIRDQLPSGEFESPWISLGESPPAYRHVSFTLALVLALGVVPVCGRSGRHFVCSPSD